MPRTLQGDIVLIYYRGDRDRIDQIHLEEIGAKLDLIIVSQLVFTHGNPVDNAAGGRPVVF